MKKSRFSQEQIVAALQLVQAGGKVDEICRKLGVYADDVLPLEAGVRRHGRERGEEAEGARGRESAAEEDRR